MNIRQNLASAKVDLKRNVDISLISQALRVVFLLFLSEDLRSTGPHGCTAMNFKYSFLVVRVRK